MNDMAALNTLMFPALMLFLMIGSIAGLFTGVALVLRPAWILRINMYSNRWVATRHISNILERVIKVDRWIYRHHYTTGILLLVGSIFLIYFFSSHIDRVRVLIGLSRAYSIPLIYAEILLDSGVLSILLGATFALIISIFMLIRPSMLRGFEQGANQWISLRRALKSLEVSRNGVDEYVFQHIQMAGVLLLFASLYTITGLTVWL